jgi:hypothetical protein
MGTTFYKFEPGSIVSYGNMYYELQFSLSSSETDAFVLNSTPAYLQNSIEISELNVTGKKKCSWIESIRFLTKNYL